MLNPLLVCSHSSWPAIDSGAAPDSSNTVAAGIDDPAIKAELRDATDAAVKRGVFGVPTFFVDGDMFWGHARMDYVAQALA
jgi:2-hydroxychromene-2-carboxylate isomerase